MDWERKSVLVTGGASFIGSHLVEALLKRGVKNLRVVDNLSSGKMQNIAKLIDDKKIDFIEGDLLFLEDVVEALNNIDVVFHLAAEHGGRGYVDLHQVEPATNMWLDQMLMSCASKQGIEKFIYASSGCIYPNYKQQNIKEELYLTEEDDGRNGGYDADNMYGWAKLMAEMTLKAYCKEGKLKGSSLRFFTVYGSRGKEDHAIIAMIARAFTKKDPFEVWGNGEQIRNWTHVSDIVEGFILAAEEIDDGTAINLGTMERIKVIDAVKEVIAYTHRHYNSGYGPEIKFLPNMPTGPLNRVADNELAKKLLGWEPKIKFMDGLHETIKWYFKTKDKKEVEEIIKTKLTEK